ncbi:MAG: VOC family protein [Rhodospirillaceae bacterium]
MNAAKPRLKRIKMATIGAPDVAKVETWYSEYLDYQVVERGIVPSPLAESWRAAGSAGRPYVLLGPASGEDVFVRAVEIDPVPEFKTLTTHGWAAIEITVSNVDKVMEKVKRSPFRVIGAPHALTPTSPIRAMQVIGPAGEVVYLTGNTGDRAASNHPEIKTLIDRIFIMVLAGPDLAALKKFYLEKFQLGDQGDLAFPVSVLADAQGLPAEHIYSLSVLVASERGNKLELDQYEPQFGTRPGPADQLSPGVAMATFEANGLDNLTVDFIKPPAPLYEGYTAATFFGPAGERTELITVS